MFSDKLRTHATKSQGCQVIPHNLWDYLQNNKEVNIGTHRGWGAIDDRTTKDKRKHKQYIHKKKRGQVETDEKRTQEAKLNIICTEQETRTVKQEVREQVNKHRQDSLVGFALIFVIYLKLN